MADFDIASKERDGMGPHGTNVGLLRVLGPDHGATPVTAGTAHLPRPLRFHRAAQHAA